MKNSDNNKRIPLNIPYLKGSEKKYILECIKSNWVSSVGPFVQEFEKKFSSYLECNYAVACSSGTAALHLALLSTGIKKNDLVLVSDLTFIASVNVIRYVNAEPILIDASQNSWQIDVKILENFLEQNCYLNGNYCYLKKNKKRVFGILAVHILGYAANISKIKFLCKKFKLKLIEDAAESLGAKYNSKYIGTFGEAGCFSFNGNKTITTGSGGMLVTNSKNIARLAKHLSQQAKSNNNQLSHNMIGYNYRMSNIHAALGLAQLKELNQILKKKKSIASFYYKNLVFYKDISFAEHYKNTISSNWLITININTKKIKLKLDEIVNKLLLKGITTRKLWQPMHLSEPHKKSKYITTNNVSNALYKTCLSLPSSANLSKSDQIKVINTFKKVISLNEKS